jgi:hypothetical protein
MFRSTLYFSVSMIIMGGCSSSGAASRGSAVRPGDTFMVRVEKNAPAVTRDISATPKEVWAAIPASFADLGYQGGPSAHSGELLYLTPTLNIGGRLYPDLPNSAYLDCGRAPSGGEAADEYAVQFAVLVRVMPRAAGGSTVKVLVDGQARERTGSSDTIHCSGTGRLEKMFVEAIERRVRQGQTPTRGE